MKKLFLVAAFLTAAAGCRSNLFLGQVEGVAATAVSPHGHVPLFAANVAIEGVAPDATDYRAETLTSAAGGFGFPAVPDGRYRLDLASGNGLFVATYYVDVLDEHSPGEMEIAMRPAHAATFVVVPGWYDDMGLLFSALGYQYRTLDVGNLAVVPNPLADADIVCLNSGADTAWADNPVVIGNLREFVAGGGRLLVSDRAWPFIKAAWPNAAAWGGNPEVGTGDQNIVASFADGELRRCVTIPEWRLRYDLGGWALPATTTGTVWVRGDAATSGGTRADAPLLFSFKEGDGVVTFATFGWRTELADGRVPVRVFNYLAANI